MDAVELLGVMKMFSSWILVMVLVMVLRNRFRKNHCIIHLTWVNVMVCKLASIELLKNCNGEAATHTGTHLEGLSMAKSGTI